MMPQKRPNESPSFSIFSRPYRIRESYSVTETTTRFSRALIGSASCSWQDRVRERRFRFQRLLVLIRPPLVDSLDSVRPTSFFKRKRGLSKWSGRTHRTPVRPPFGSGRFLGSFFCLVLVSGGF